ncbi:MAG: peptidoglycan-binding protein [Elainellaceae cyanobacterium]
MESIGYLYSLAAQDSDAASITAQDNVDALNDAIGPLSRDVKRAVGSASRHAVTLACSASIVLATSSSAMALRRGDSGANVTQLQQDLAAMGAYSGPVTGFYGSLTEAAVQDFQSSRGLVADGIAGSSTLSAMGGAAPQPTSQAIGAAGNPNVLARGNQGAAVTDLQRALSTAGYFSGPVTGYYGSLTEAAVLQFQQAAGLTADGIAGPVTLAQLAADRLPVATEVAFIPAVQSTTTVVQPATVSTPTSAAVGDVLYLGDRGQTVLSLQTTLADLGYYSKKRLTGYYGSSTEAAVKSFQGASGLVVNGIAGPLTFEKLQERVNRSL